MKLSLSQLERARRAPKALAAAQFQKFGLRPTFAGYWVFAAKLYHKLSKANVQDALPQAQDYFLQHCREKLMSDRAFEEKITLYSRRLENYVAKQAALNQPTIQTNKRIEFKGVPNHLVTGTIGRLDLVTTGGFAATNFELHPSEWRSELRTAVIQQALAEEFRRSPSEIRVGAYCITSEEHDYITLSSRDLRKAIAELPNVFASVQAEMRRIEQSVRTGT